MTYSQDDRTNASTGCGCVSALLLLGFALMFGFAAVRTLGGMIVVFIAAYFATNLFMRYAD